MKSSNTQQSPQSLGGQVTAKKLRKEALEKYYLNPNICKQCGNIITVPDKGKVKETRVKQFCNSSCFAKFSNVKRVSTVKIIYCKRCGKKLYLYRKSSGRFSSCKYCKKCRYLRIRFDSSKFDQQLPGRTKGEMFKKSANYQSARGMIRRHACQVFAVSGIPYVCDVCGYKKHINVCHIRSVADFPDDATVSEINSLTNLVALCPNHHWELDHGFLNLTKFK